MTRRKTLKELTIKDNFMFGAVMCEESNCKRLLELVLGFSIERVEVSKEKSIIYHPEYKGVRLDVYAKDEKNTHYNVEMQAVAHAFLGKRSRYYHSQMDMDQLDSEENMRNFRIHISFLFAILIHLVRENIVIHLSIHVKKHPMYNCRMEIKLSF